MSELIGQVDQAKIDQWKKEVEDKQGKAGSVFAYQVEGRVGYLRSVDRDLFASASAKINTAGPAKFMETIVKGVWLGGDDTLLSEEGYYFGLVEFVDEMMNKKKGELVKL